MIFVCFLFLSLRFLYPLFCSGVEFDGTIHFTRSNFFSAWKRKLHDRLFLVLLYNLLCKTFKDHSSAFAASSLSERNPLLQECCFPIASAKVEHFCIPCKRSPKKNARKIHLFPFCHLIALQNRQQSPFFRPFPTPPFSLQNLRFSRFSPF